MSGRQDNINSGIAKVVVGGRYVGEQVLVRRGMVREWYTPMFRSGMSLEPIPGNLKWLPGYITLTIRSSG